MRVGRRMRHEVSRLDHESGVKYDESTSATRCKSDRRFIVIFAISIALDVRVQVPDVRKETDNAGARLAPSRTRSRECW